MPPSLSFLGMSTSHGSLGSLGPISPVPLVDENVDLNHGPVPADDSPMVQAHVPIIYIYMQMVMNPRTKVQGFTAYQRTTVQWEATTRSPDTHGQPPQV